MICQEGGLHSVMFPHLMRQGNQGKFDSLFVWICGFTSCGKKKKTQREWDLNTMPLQKQCGSLKHYNMDKIQNESTDLL